MQSCKAHDRMLARMTVVRMMTVTVMIRTVVQACDHTLPEFGLTPERAFEHSIATAANGPIIYMTLSDLCSSE